MSVVLWLALAWLVAAPVAAIVMGKGIGLADERDAARSARVEPEPRPDVRRTVDLPRPRSADTRSRVTGRQ